MQQVSSTRHVAIPDVSPSELAALHADIAKPSAVLQVPQDSVALPAGRGQRSLTRCTGGNPAAGRPRCLPAGLGQDHAAAVARAAQAVTRQEGEVRCVAPSTEVALGM